MAYNLKSAEEVKEYLKNLHIEYKFGCYSEKNPEVCFLLANFSETVKKDFKTAATLYKSTCDDYNYARGCTKYGDYRLVGKTFHTNMENAGKGSKEDANEAYKYMLRGCELNDENGCFHAGVLALSDKNVEKDRGAQVKRGIEMLQKACTTYNNEKACFFLSGVYLSGVEGHLEKNLKEAYKLSLKCCEKGNPYACANVSQMHARGEGVQKNPDLAAVFKERAETLYRAIKESPTMKFQQGINP